MPATESLTQRQFDRIATIAKHRWGLALTPQKRQLVTSRLLSFMRGAPFEDVDAYLAHLEAGKDERALLSFFDTLSTNVTSFFRDRAHFDYLERELFTGLARGTLSLPGRRLRMWSAGCSTGCEPYTMAMVAYDRLESAGGWDVQILATDLSNYAVEEASAGAYEWDSVKDLPRETLRRHFEERDGRWRVRPHLRQMVKVGQLNLMEDWPMRGPFDVIFCRNVMIYFDGPTRERLVRRFLGLLRPGGVFAVGSAETLAGMDLDVRSVMPSLYVK
ncbi:MAG: protein-glutamate O-methyltransferase CheR [Leptolyngbya sp. PLA1]|nr:protein-glutamate O-methyltransferase CheR [Leptolyngbya sp. PLA1]